MDTWRSLILFGQSLSKNKTGKIVFIKSIIFQALSPNSLLVKLIGYKSIFVIGNRQKHHSHGIHWFPFIRKK